MSLQVEKLEHNMAKLTIEVSAEEVEKALQAAYLKERSKISLPGFRKGKVPRQMIEKMYGPEVFYDEAANRMISEAYAKAYDESELEIASQPTIDIVQLEKGKPFIFTAEVAVKPEVKLGEYKGLKVDKYSTRVTQKEVDEEFEEQLIGAELEKEVEVKVTFPEDYHSEDLKGKEAVFKCTVHAIRAKELPEVDDEFASDVSEKAETLDAYRAEVKAQIKEPMVDLQAKQMADDFARRIMQQGLSVEQYFQFTGLSEEKMMEELKPQAEKRIRTRLVLEAIVAAENIEVSDERLDEELAKMAESYKMEVEKLKEFMGENEKKQMKEDIAVQDAVTLIVDASVEG